MGKQRGHRRQHRKRSIDPTPTIRVVEQPGASVPAEPVSGGCASAPVAEVGDNGRGDGVREAEAGGHLVVAPPLAESAIVASYVNDDGYLILVSGSGHRTEFVPREPSIYEMRQQHHIIWVAKAALRCMFTQTDCVWVQIRATYSDLITVTCWAVREFVLPVDGVETTFFSIRYDDWVRHAPDIDASGGAFRERLASELAQHGREFPWVANHWTDRHLGAFAEMLHHGQVDKAVVLYNRFARFAGLNQFSLVSHDPLLIDIAGAVLHFENGDFRVIRCLQ